MKKIDEQFFVNDNQTKTSSVDDVLVKDEKLLWQQTPKKSNFVMQITIKSLPIAFIWLLIDVSIIVTLVTTMEDSSFIWFIIPFFALHLAPVWIYIASVIKAYAKVKNLKYVITNKRVMIIDGKDMFISNSINLNDIKSCNVHQTFTSKLARVADITILSNSDNAIVFNNIKDAKFICKKINEIASSPAEASSFGKITCNYCGSIYDSLLNKCPSCGATRKE